MATPNTYMNLNAAAKYSGWNKSTLSKAVKSGRLPVKERKGNQFFIDPVDLEREFPKKQSNSTNSNNNQQSATAIKVSELELELKYLNEKVSDMKIQLEKEERNHEKTKEEKQQLLDTITNQTKLLTYQQEAIQKAAETPVEQHRGFFARLFGK